MSQSPPDAAVIIPHYNDQTRLARCLDALVPQLEDAPGTAEIVVVDNNSDPALKPAYMARWPQVRFIVETGKGAALARNRGVAETTAPALFFIDSDCLPAQDWLATAFAVRDRAPLVGGSVPVFDETPPPRSGAEAFEAVFAFDFKTYIEQKGFSGSGNLVTRRGVFDAIGGFRPGLSEDLDWCQRATAAGFALVYAEELCASHPSRSDWPALRRKWRRLTDETWGLRDHGAAGRLRWGLRALAMPLSALAHTPKVLRSARLDSGQERLAALGTLYRLRIRRGLWMIGQALR
ncbi:glycosyltransferase family 2 protein [Pacificoceanicola onchidii]|uniref:glycosyltransferase family 2 protein n=1 Tax=Pacificoceanicola onchidii TaxID=2562685 RepID=UPI0010A66240|nr:glycosyltransferase [Pacificoceanicola onchidii]